MSDAFKNLDFGNQAQNLIQESQDRSTKLAALDKTRTTRGTIEENVGFLKSALSGKELLERTYKGLKPYVKQQLTKGARAAADKITQNSQNALDEATDARTALETQHAANATARSAEEASDTQDIQDAMSVAKAGGATDAELSGDAGVQSAVSASFSNAVARQGAELADSGAMNDADLAVAKASQTLARQVAVKAVAKKVATKVGEDVGEETGEAVGEISGSEALGAVLDATGIGAPIGLLIGALGIGLGIRAGSAKRAPKLGAVPLNQSGRSFQVGEN